MHIPRMLNQPLMSQLPKERPNHVSRVTEETVKPIPEKIVSAKNNKIIHFKKLEKSPLHILLPRSKSPIPNTILDTAHREASLSTTVTFNSPPQYGQNLNNRSSIIVPKPLQQVHSQSNTKIRPALRTPEEEWQRTLVTVLPEPNPRHPHLHLAMPVTQQPRPLPRIIHVQLATTDRTELRIDIVQASVSSRGFRCFRRCLGSLIWEKTGDIDFRGFRGYTVAPPEPNPRSPAHAKVLVPQRYLTLPPSCICSARERPQRFWLQCSLSEALHTKPYLTRKCLSSHAPLQAQLTTLWLPAKTQTSPYASHSPLDLER